MPAGADTKTVTYDCTASGAGSGSASPYLVSVGLTGAATATAGTGFIATLVIGGATPILQAPASGVPQGASVQIVPTIEVSGNPSPGSSSNVAPTATALAAAIVAAGSAITPIPTVTVSVTPSTGATSITLLARGFSLKLIPSGGTGTAAPLYDCTPATSAGASILPAAMTVGVGTPSASSSATQSTTTSATASTTPTPTASATPKVTKTVQATVTKGSDGIKTPGGGAATGGGGEMGPDGRTFVLAGSIMVLGAAFGGLALRRRRLMQG